MNVFILSILFVSITLNIFLGSFKLVDYKLTKDIGQDLSILSLKKLQKLQKAYFKRSLSYKYFVPFGQESNRIIKEINDRKEPFYKNFSEKKYSEFTDGIMLRAPTKDGRKLFSENTINNIKYYLEEIKKNVKNSVLMVHDESYGHVAEDFISLLESLSSNPMSCFNSDNLAKIEKKSMNILSVAYDAGLRERIPVFPLVESYFYIFLYLCRSGVDGDIQR